jgi:hypothetical protein
MNDPDERHGLPLPSEDTGDLTQTPPSGDTHDFLVAREEGVPYVPASERVMSDPRLEEGGPDLAAAADSEAAELRQTDLDEDLAMRALDALRRSDVIAGDRLTVSAVGGTLVLQGQVASIDVLNEVLGMLGDVDGVDEVVDRTQLTGA